MDIHIFNANLDRLGIADVFSSLIWHRKFFQPGSFELYAPATASNLELLRQYNLIVKPKSREVGYIHSIVIEDKENEGEMITATGSFLSGLLSNRTIRTEATSLADLITQNCINTDAGRIIPRLEIGNCENILFDNTVKGKNLGAFLEALSRRNNFGYRIAFDIASRKLQFETFYGTDRSIEQSANPRVRFCQQYDNLLGSIYTVSDAGAVDSVYCNVTGLEGVVYNSVPEYHIDGKAGYARNEITLDVPAVTYTVQYETGSVTYLNASKTQTDMQAAANAALVDATENFEGTVAFSYGYKTEYDLGDIVTVLNQKWRLTISERITEVVEVYDNERNSITPTFGNPAATIMDILKEKG